MNQVLRHAASISPNFSFAFRENLLESSKLKTILIISSIAIGIFVAISIIYDCCFNKKNNSPNLPPPPTKIIKTVPSLPKPILKSPFQKPKIDLPSPVFGKQPITWYHPGNNGNLQNIIKPPVVNPPVYNPTKPYISPYNPNFNPHINAVKPFQPTYNPVNPVKPLDPTDYNPTQQNNRFQGKCPLETVKEEINDWQNDLLMQKKLLETIESPKAQKKGKKDITQLVEDDLGLDDIQDCDNRKKEIEAEIAELQKKLAKSVNNFLTTWLQLMQDNFTGYGKKDNNRIVGYIAELSGLFDDKNSLNKETICNNEDFVYNCLKQIDVFLTKSFFASGAELSLQEEKKVDLIVFHEFFAIVDKHYKLLEKKDPELAIKMKIKLANLPLVDEKPAKVDWAGKITAPSVPTDRAKKYPNLNLTEKNQLDILIKHFKNEEDTLVGTIIYNLNAYSTQKFTQEDVKKLARMLVPGKSRLSNANRIKLQDAFKASMGNQAPQNWNKVDDVQNKLEAYFKPSANYGFNFTYGQNTSSVMNLHRASKAKEFFEKQIGLSENEIMIPRWYHATKLANIEPIIQAGQVNVEHKQAFKGAWISTAIEGDFGQDAFGFKHLITKLDPDVFIGFEKGMEKKRWRGLQAPIPLIDANTKTSNVCLIGLHKSTKKGHKAKTISNMKKIGVANPTVVSLDQLSYLQREIIKIIGNPNLSERWWGKADASQVDKALQG